MSNKNLFVSLGLVVLLILVVGCAKAPQQEVDAAKAALTLAKDSEADRYLADEFKAAEDTLNAALAEIEAQNSKFALGRNYNRAKALLASSTEMFNLANSKVEARKEEVKAEGQQLMLDLQAALSEAKTLLKKAPKGKEGREVLQAFQNDLMAVETSLGEVTTLMDSGDFLGAKDKLSAGLNKVKSIIEELNQAIAKKAR